MAFKIESQLSENQIESDVSSYLGYITPFWSERYRLISVDEQLTGADKLFNRFVPIFMQFKVSHGLNPGGSIHQRFRNKPLARIIQYRNENNLAGNPILYFQLRKQAKTALDLQHNILLKLHEPPSQYGLYIAPLTLDLTEYENQLNDGWRMRSYPFDPFFRRELEIHEASVNRNWILGLNPFLKHHISIPPHKAVATSEHHYSFSKSGADVAWHSGELRYSDFRLSSQLLQIFNYYYNREGFGITQVEFSEFIDRFYQENRISGYDGFNDDTTTNKIFNFANNLKTDFQISLMLLGESKGKR